MEQQISDLSEQISRHHDEGNQLDQELEENQSEKNVKYRDLRKREEAMDQFLQSFEDNKQQELERCIDLHQKVSRLFRKSSRKITPIFLTKPFRLKN